MFISFFIWFYVDHLHKSYCFEHGTYRFYETVSLPVASWKLEYEDTIRPIDRNCFQVKVIKCVDQQVCMSIHEQPYVIGSNARTCSPSIHFEYFGHLHTYLLSFTKPLICFLIKIVHTRTFHKITSTYILFGCISYNVIWSDHAQVAFKRVHQKIFTCNFLNVISKVP